MTWELVPESTPRAGRPSSWGTLVLVGAVVTLIGVSLLIWPFFAASRIIAILVGAAFVANGLGTLLGFRGRGFAIPAGVLLLILGVVAMAFPDFTVTVLVSFLAFGTISVGVLWLLISLRLKSAGAQLGPLSIAIPAVIAALGLAALIWPALALTLAAIAAGVVTLLIGATLIWGGLRVRRARSQSGA